MPTERPQGDCEPEMTIVPRLARLLPTALLEPPLDALARSVARRHPRLFSRLGRHAGRPVAIVASDMPFVFLLTAHPERPRVAVARDVSPSAVAIVRGPLATLVALARGHVDGDAVFFSREIVVEGDMEAVLALRNALDDAEIDLFDEAAALFGPLSPLARRCLVAGEAVHDALRSPARARWS